LCRLHSVELARSIAGKGRVMIAEKRGGHSLWRKRKVDEKKRNFPF